MAKFNYERTYKAADTAYYRLAKLEPMFGMPEADSFR